MTHSLAAGNRTFYLRLLIVFVIAGESCRLAQYLSNQSFWEDEVAVLVNVKSHPASELPFVRLESYAAESPVAAPPVFLWTTKWMGDTYGYREWSVRLLSLVCSTLSLPLFALLACRLTNPAAAAWATGLMALSDPLLFQAANVKPYSGDVLAAIVITLLAMSRPSQSVHRRLLMAAIAAAIAEWISYPAVFTFAAVSLALWPEIRRQSLRGILLAGACCLPVVCSFATVYLLCMRKQRDPALDVYWMHLFPNFSRPLTLPAWFFGGTWEMFHYWMDPLGPIMLIAAVLGIVQLRRQKNWTILILLVAPIALNLLAAFIGQFPYGGNRLTLFLSPYVFLLCGIGAASIPVLWGRAILAITPAAMIGLAVQQLFVPRSKGDLRDAVTYLLAHRQPTETVYLVGNQTNGAATWYLPNRDALVHEHLEQKAPIHGGNFWLVISYEPRKYAENKPALTQPDATIDPARRFHVSGADVAWFAARP